jgi:hypothetical protein
MRRELLVSILFAFACVRHVGAASTTNFSDQWWNPNESGWGASALQQGDVIFFDLFVFGAGNEQTSFTSAVSRQGTTAQGNLIFSGDLYLVSGPYFGGAFNPANVTRRKVGTLTFEADSVDTALLTYSVDGVVVNKSITRQLWRFENLTGNYYGGLIYDNANCVSPELNGHVEELTALNVSHSPDNSISMSYTNMNGTTCTFSAMYSQAGHMGTMQGDYSCSNGGVGTFTAYELEKTISGLTGRFVAQNNLCQASGRLGGILR